MQTVRFVTRIAFVLLFCRAFTSAIGDGYEKIICIPNVRLEGIGIAPADSGGVVITGRYEGSGLFSTRMMALRINQHGDTTGIQLLPGIEGEAIQRTKDGGYVFAGFMANHHPKQYDSDRTQGIIVVKLGADFNFEWKSVIPGTFNSTPKMIRECSDDSYLVLGTCGENNARIARIDAKGKLLQDNSHLFEIYAGDFDCTPDSGCIIIGTTPGYSKNQFYILKMDKDLNIVWSKKFTWKKSPTSYDDNNWGYSVRTVREGGYLLGGINMYSEEKARMVKLSATGEEEWTLNSESRMLTNINILQVADGNFIMSSLAKGDSLVLTKVDAQGQLTWKKKYGNMKLIDLGAMTEIPGGDLVITGVAQRREEGADAGVYVLRVHADGKMYK